MAANKILNIPPAFLPSAAGNLLNVNITSLAGPVGFTMTQPYIVIKHIRLTNNDSGAPHTAKLFKGATGGSAAGTEFAFAGGVSIAASSYVDWYGQARFDAADFLTGIADTASKVTINIDAEIGVA
jgi:hypothetical protein